MGSGTLVLHGGLFRKPANRAAVKRKRKRKLTSGGPLVLGTLEELRGCSKGGPDPNGLGATTVATDVLWSDPGLEPGLRLNTARGVGLVFGPDVTQVLVHLILILTLPCPLQS